MPYTLEELEETFDYAEYTKLKEAYETTKAAADAAFKPIGEILKVSPGVPPELLRAYFRAEHEAEEAKKVLMVFIGLKVKGG